MNWSSPGGYGAEQQVNLRIGPVSAGCQIRVSTTNWDELNMVHFCLIVFGLDKHCILFCIIDFSVGRFFFFASLFSILIKSCLLYVSEVNGVMFALGSAFLNPCPLFTGNFWRIKFILKNKLLGHRKVLCCMDFCCWLCSLGSRSVLFYLFCPWEYKKMCRK